MMLSSPISNVIRKATAVAALLGMVAAPMFAEENRWDEGDNGGQRIRHVFVVTLENEGYTATFGPTSKAPYLSQTLPTMGALLTQYYGTGHVSLGGTVIAFAGQYCCSEQPGPHAPAFPHSTTLGTYTISYNDYGEDRTGAVLLSPFIKPGTVSNTPFNHYSLLKTMEDIFETRGYLGYAAQPGLLGFFGCVNSDVQTAPAISLPPAGRARISDNTAIKQPNTGASIEPISFD